MYNTRTCTTLARTCELAVQLGALRCPPDGLRRTVSYSLPAATSLRLLPLCLLHPLPAGAAVQPVLLAAVPLAALPAQRVRQSAPAAQAGSAPSPGLPATAAAAAPRRAPNLAAAAAAAAAVAAARGAGQTCQRTLQEGKGARAPALIFLSVCCMAADVPSRLAPTVDLGKPKNAAAGRLRVRWVRKKLPKARARVPEEWRGRHDASSRCMQHSGLR